MNAKYSLQRKVYQKWRNFINSAEHFLHYIEAKKDVAVNALVEKSGTLLERLRGRPTGRYKGLQAHMRPREPGNSVANPGPFVRCHAGALL